jgi:hypothetical protein
MKSESESSVTSVVKSPTRRQRMFIRRALRLEAKAKTLFGKMRESIALAMQNGLQIDQPVEIEVIGADGKPAKKFVRIKNNFAWRRRIQAIVRLALRAGGRAEISMARRTAKKAT